jgi:long-chain acyl-CoA synthetase
LKRFVDEANDNIPMYKRVKRFCLRETEFEKNASKKIKRYLVEKKLT